MSAPAGEDLFFYVLIAPDGARIEFGVEAEGETMSVQEGQPPLKLTPSGRGVETSAHKLILMDVGEPEFFDNVADPEGTTNIAANPANAVQVQVMIDKLNNFPATTTSPEPMEAIPMGPTDGPPTVPKVTAPAPAVPEAPAGQPTSPAPMGPTVPELPSPASPSPESAKAPPVPKKTLPSAGGPPPKPITGKIKLPEPGLPRGLEMEEDLPVTPSKAPGPKPPTPPVPKPGGGAGPPPMPKSGTATALPPVPSKSPAVLAKIKGPEPKEQKEVEEESSDLQEDLLKEFDTDGDGRITGDEIPSEEQLKQFTNRRREKTQTDQVDSKRKSRIEAEAAVKSALRELEEARVHEELSAREELEAHKLTIEKAKKELAQNEEEAEKIRQADKSKHEKNDAALAKLKQEQEHAEDLIRHTIRAKKAEHLEDEDRVHELDNELHLLHEEEAERIRCKEEDDQRREEEDRAAHERYLERVKADEDEISKRKEQMARTQKEEQSLKGEIDEKEKIFQEKARDIKFEDDDEHSRNEHKLDVLQKSSEKLEAQINIEEEEINNLSVKLDVRRITQADDKKSELRQAAAENEAQLMKESLEAEETVKSTDPVIDKDQPPKPDLEPSLPKSEKAEPISPKSVPPALPSGSTPDLPTLPETKPDVQDKSLLPEMPKSIETKTSEDKPAFPELPKPISSGKPVFPDLPKPSGSAEDKAEKPVLPALPIASGKPGLPAGAPSPNLPPPARASKPTGDLPPLPVPAVKPDLQTPPGGDKPSGGEELERNKIEKQLQRIADDRAERQRTEPNELPVIPDLPKVDGAKPRRPAVPKPASKKPILPTVSAAARGAAPKPALPKSGVGAPAPPLPNLPTPAGEKPALPPSTSLPSGGTPKPVLPPPPKPESGGPSNLPSLPKPGGLPPLPGPISIEDEADQQTREQERDV